MDDAAPVRLADRLAGLEDVVDGLLDRQPTARLQRLREILSREALHDDVRRAVGQCADLEDPNDVLALDGGGGSRLTTKACRGSAAISLVGGEELDRDLSA